MSGDPTSSSSPRLLAISDLHVNHRGQLARLAELPEQRDDWLILAGDIGDRPRHLAAAFDVLVRRFRRVLWVPGNHELWTVPKTAPRGMARYREQLDVAQAYGVTTPEDPWLVWEGEGGPVTICLLFLGFDYTFRPDDVASEDVLAWAKEGSVRSRDETRLHFDPYPSRAAWCEARCDAAEARLSMLLPGTRTVLVNHYPLRQDLVRLVRHPRYAPWCGTRRTEDWHLRFNAAVCINGHLHMRSTDWRDGVRFEEVALGYPRHWDRTRTIASYHREIQPPDGAVPHDGPFWRP